ncbi:HAD-IA family hydrolase [Candidatus Pseudothioglobus singularis]|nr:HAD-IA family hydrolase [Candidatus Pseudothioglobus singularis]MDB4848125.1 HAD-IA family hydrolase [Candidatus Pseudothioglobus singularis]
MMVNITLDIGAIQLEALVNVLIKYEKLIFDLDDTVFSEDIFDYLSFKSIASKFYLMGDIDADLYAKKGIMQKRISRKYLFDQISPNINNDDIDEIVEYYQNFKCGSVLQNYSIRDLLKEMHSKGKQIFIVTNGHPIRQMNKIKDLGIENYLSDIYICHPLTHHQLKPSGEVLDKIGISQGSKDCLVIGDNAKIDGDFAKNRYIDFHLFKFPKAKIQ